MEEIKHFCHEHPLHLRDYNNSNSLNCDLCWRRIYGPHYHCRHGCDFDLHTGCTDAPSQIEHPDHPDHLLTFLPNSPYDDHNDVDGICNKCGDLLRGGFTYHCSICKFDLHSRCAFPWFPQKIEIKSHKHHPPLIFLNRDALLLCDACGKEHRGYFYTCNTCLVDLKSEVDPFFIHTKCALLPNTFKHSGHEHPLDLSYYIPPQYSQFFPRCKICSVQLNPKYWVYYCGPCRYFAHVDCATTLKSNSVKAASKSRKTDVEVEDSASDAFPLPVLDESVSLVSHFLSQMVLKEKKGEKTASMESHDLFKAMKLEEKKRTNLTIELYHFSHQHPLVLFDHVQTEAEESSLKNEVVQIKCNGCVQPISNSPFYRCAAQCNFFLHKCCVELPTEVVQHPFHPQHSLTLLAKSSSPIGWFQCACCSMECNGFTYHCSSCNLYLDVKCGHLPFTITHEAHHEHLLLFKKIDSKAYPSCNACGYYIYEAFGFGCNTCNFNLHARCALFPRTIRDKYDKDHPFVLTYSPVKDYPCDDYFCERCERELDPTKWFYHCDVCNNSLHIRCTRVGHEYANVEFGVTFDTNYHQHQLTFVPEAKVSSMCGKCGHHINLRSPTLECSQCQFKIHTTCIR